MLCFKVIQNDKIIDVSSAFLKWVPDQHQMFICETDQGQFVLGQDSEIVYRDKWMRPIPDQVGEYIEAEVVRISEQEYYDLYALLQDGEEIDEHQEEPVEEVIEEAVEEPEEPKVMTVAEMRQTIKEQQKQIQMLTECILELSQAIYE